MPKGEIMPIQSDHGITLTTGKGLSKMRLQCEHQKGIIYAVPAEMSWVCEDTTMPAHALAGFFNELLTENRSLVRDLMQKWGIYFRQLPLNDET